MHSSSQARYARASVFEDGQAISGGEGGAEVQSGGGEEVEVGDTEPMFSGDAKQAKTKAFLSGDFG